MDLDKLDQLYHSNTEILPRQAPLHLGWLVYFFFLSLSLLPELVVHLVKTKEQLFMGLPA